MHKRHSNFTPGNRYKHYTNNDGVKHRIKNLVRAFNFYR